MKKIFLLTIIALAGFKGAFAQGITISRGGVDYTNGTIDAWYDIAEYPGSSAYTFSGFVIKNTGTTTKSLKMKRMNCFCTNHLFRKFILMNLVKKIGIL